MAVIIYTGNKVKSNRGEEKKKGFNWIFLLVSMQYPWKYLAFSWHYRRKHPRILYLCNWIGNRWTSLRMQYFLAVLIHWEKSVIQPSKQVKEAQKQLFYRAYLHHWLSVTVHFNRYNLCFDKYTECGDKCKSVYFIALHICVVPLSFSLFCECPLSDTRCWMIGHFRRYVTEHLLNTKVVVFLEFLWFAVCFLFSRRCWMIESVIKPENFCKVYVWFAWKSVEQCAMGDIRWEKCNKVELFA